MLSDPNKKVQYDRFGHAGVGTAPPTPHGQGGGGFGGFDVDSDAFGDIFGDLFGSERTRQSRSRKGADLRFDLELDMESAFNGKEVPIEYSRRELCGSCGGSGAKQGTSSKTCPQCKGSGQVRYSQGFFSFGQTCPRCKGSGQTIETPCPNCRGGGTVKASHKLTVRIPPGVDNGTSLRISGAGDASSKGTAPGDLFVIMRVKDDPRFVRQDDDLITELNVGFPEAVLGGEFEMQTIDGKVTLKVPAGTNPNTTFRVRGAGFTRLGRKGRGDLLVRTNIFIPKNINEHQRKALEDFAKASSEGGSGSDNIFKKVFR